MGAAEAIQDLDVHGEEPGRQPEVQGLQVGHDCRWQVLDAGPRVPDETVPLPREGGRLVPLAAPIKEPYLAFDSQIGHAFHCKSPAREVAQQHDGAVPDRAGVEVWLRDTVAVELERGPGEGGPFRP